MVLLPISNGLSPPPLVEDPDRFYRSGEKCNRLNPQESPVWEDRRLNLCTIGKVYRMSDGIVNTMW